MHIRKDDQVEVIAGDDRGTPEQRRFSKVLRVLPARNKIVVEGINRVYKHMRPSRQNPQGGRLSKEMPIDVSNVMLVMPQVQPGGPHRPPVQRRRAKAALLQVVRPGPGQHRTTQAGTRRLDHEETLIKINLFSRRRHTKQKDATRGGMKDDGNGSPAGPVQEGHRHGDGREIQPRQPDGDPQDRQDRHQHGGGPRDPGQSPARRRPPTA